MNESELVSAMVATHHYPADEEQLQALTAMYRSVRDGAEAIGALVGTCDASPALRFKATPE